MSKRRLLSIGRVVHLNNESKIAKVWLEGLESTHQVIEHTKEGVIFRSLNGDRVREIFNLDIHYLIPNQYGGWNSEVLECRSNLS